MRILQLCPRVPFPLHDGGAIGIYHITKYLALRRHAITMVTFGRNVPRELSEYCDLKIVDARTGHSVRKLADSWMSRIPYIVAKFRNTQYRAVVEQLAAQHSFDVVHVDHLVMAQYGLMLKRKFGLPVVLREHNVETSLMERFGKTQRNPGLRVFAMIEARRLRHYEAEVCSSVDASAMITKTDEQSLQAIAPRARTVVIPAGVEIPHAPLTEANGCNVLFLASLDWQPNLDGLYWFRNEVLPILRKRDRAVKLLVAGKGASEKVEALAGDNVEVLGFVQDLEPLYAKTQVCIVPLFAGSGMRIKILEMLARGKAVVTTSLGCEGMNLDHGKHLLVADTAEEFASAVWNLLANPAQRMELGYGGRSVVETRYDWRAVAESFEWLYSSVQRTAKSA